VLAEVSEIGLGFLGLTIGLFETRNTPGEKARNTPGEKAAVFSKPILFNCSVGTAIRNKRGTRSQPASACPIFNQQPVASSVRRNLLWRTEIVGFNDVKGIVLMKAHRFYLFKSIAAWIPSCNTIGLAQQ